MLLTSEAHKRSEQTHTNSPDTCTVKIACGFTACYPENLLSYLAHVHAVDTRPSFFVRGVCPGRFSGGECFFCGGGAHASTVVPGRFGNEARYIPSCNIRACGNGKRGSGEMP